MFNTEYSGMKGGQMERLLQELTIGFPPSVTDITHNAERGNSKINNPGIQGLRWFFTHLLGGSGADGTLRIRQMV